MGTMVGDGSGMGFMAEYLGYEGQTHLGTKSMAGRSAMWMILQLIVEGAGEDKTARDRLARSRCALASLGHAIQKLEAH